MDVADEDDDPVVREVDVFMSQNLPNDLHLFQFPLRPHFRPYDFSKISELRVKPLQQKVELRFDQDIDAASFDPSRAELSRRFCLTSTPVPNKANYAIGVLRGDQLHLNPLHAVLQMRPSFEDFEAAAQGGGPLRMIKTEAEQELEAKAKVKEEPVEAKPVQVQIKKRETERAREARKNSHAYLKAKADEEQWIDMDMFDSSTAEAKEQFEKLLCADPNHVSFDLRRPAYLNVMQTGTLDPIRVSESVAAGTAHGGSGAVAFSRQAIKPLKFEEQLSAIFARVEIASFEQLVEIATAAPSAEYLLESLPNYALCVQVPARANPRVDVCLTARSARQSSLRML